MPGEHNIANATAAIAVARSLGISGDELVELAFQVSDLLLEHREHRVDRRVQLGGLFAADLNSFNLARMVVSST